jgi:plasmid maintenance system antidote protein VapI
MPSFQITISPTRRAAARFISTVRRAIQQALVEEYKDRGLTQSDIARILKVHRSVINREIRGDKDLTLGRIGELSHALGRDPTFSLPKKKKRDGVNTFVELKPVRVKFEPPDTYGNLKADKTGGRVIELEAVT